MSNRNKTLVLLSYFMLELVFDFAKESSGSDGSD